MAEPYLLQLGFLQRTPRGRVATAAAYAHLGVAVPRGAGAAPGPGSLFDQGTCAVSDIAICGASVEEVELPKGKLPVAPFTVMLGMAGKKKEQIEIRGRVVRLRHDGKSLRLGIAFHDVGPDLETKIASIVR